jgi:hypothetical protein
MREHSIRVLFDLTRSSQSDEVRLKAALALYRIAETTAQAADPRATDAEQDKLLTALRKLYNQVQNVELPDDTPDLGPAPRPLDDEPIDIRAIAVATEPAGK